MYLQCFVPRQRLRDPLLRPLLGVLGAEFFGRLLHLLLHVALLFWRQITPAEVGPKDKGFLLGMRKTFDHAPRRSARDLRDLLRERH